MVSKPKTRIRLAFQNFNLTGDMGHCYTQYIELIDLKKRVSMVRNYMNPINLDDMITIKTLIYHTHIILIIKLI